MATWNISDLSNAVNSAYDKKIPSLFNTSGVLIEYMKKSPKQRYAGEDYFYIPWKEKMNEAVVATVEYDGTNGTYPTPLSPSYQKFRLSWKKLLTKFQLSNEMVDIQHGIHTFVNNYKTAIDDTLEAIRLDLNNYVNKSGTAALATGVSVSVDDPSSGYDTVTVDNTRHLRAGMVLDGYDSSDNHDADGIVVESILTSTTFKTSVAGGADNVDTGTVFYKEGCWVTGLDRAPNGISNIIDDDTGTFQNKSRLTYPQIRAIVSDGDSAGVPQALTLLQIRSVLDDISDGPYGKIGSGLFGYGTRGTINAFRDELATQNQPTETIATKAGDAKVPAWSQGGQLIPLIDSRGAPANTLFFINPKELVYYDAGGMWDKHGGGLLKPLEAGPALWGSYAWWGQFGSPNPAAHGRRNDITET